MQPADGRVRAWADLTDEEGRGYARAMEVYAAQVELLDQGIGRLLDMLEETGVDDDTLLVFSSDNGGQPWQASCQRRTHSSLFLCGVVFSLWWRCSLL